MQVIKIKIGVVNIVVVHFSVNKWRREERRGGEDNNK